MLSLAKSFSALNNRTAAHLIGPGVAADLSNVKLDSGAIEAQNGVGTSTIATGSGTPRSVAAFNGAYILSTEARQYVEFQNRLLWAVSGEAVKESPEGTTFQNLGMIPPQAAPSGAAGAAGTPDGTYSLYVAFYATATNASGASYTKVSGLSPAGSVTVANQKIDWSAIPTGWGTGDTHSNTTLDNVTNISAVQKGMFITGTGIPAGTTIASISGTTITLSQAATSTNVGVVLKDPQWDGRYLYRSGGTVTGIGKVQTIADMTTTTYTGDNTADTDATPIEDNAESYTIPPEADAIAVTPYGRLMLVSTDDPTLVYWSEAALPHAFLATSQVQFTETIKALAASPGETLCIGLTRPFVLTGSSPADFTQEQVNSDQGCVERDTVIDTGYGIMWWSKDGVCRYTGGGGVDVVSKASISDSTFAALSATNCKGVRYNERAIWFHSGGYLEFDPRTPGNWLKGSPICTAASYDRTNDRLLVVPTGAALAKVWEAGTALTATYKTGDWPEGVTNQLKHFLDVHINHNGATTVSVWVDGTLVTWPDASTSKTKTRSTQGNSRVRLPRGKFGRRIAIQVSGGTTVEILCRFIEMPGVL